MNKIGAVSIAVVGSIVTYACIKYDAMLQLAFFWTATAIMVAIAERSNDGPE